MTGRTVPVTIAATILVALGTFGASAHWSNARSIARSDGLGYFLYARSIVVDLDTDVTAEVADIDAHFEPAATTDVKLWTRRAPATGRLVLPWPIGSGLVMAPFYAFGWGIENVVARLEGRAPDSYGLIPQFCFGLGSLAFAHMGFWCVRACCSDLASKACATLASASVALGGPLVYYVFVQPAMAHASSYGLVGLLLFLWWRMWCGRVSAPRFGLLCLVMGTLMTVRYQNVLFGVVPLALLLSRIRSSKVGELFRLGAVGLVALALPVAVQVTHYLAMHGGLGGAVARSGGGFAAEQNAVDLASPHFVDVLLSCQHGAFYWAPVYALGFAGLGWAALRRSWARVLLLSFIANVYVIGGLRGQHAWSGGHSFGMRYLTECGALLSLGLALLLGELSRSIHTGWVVATLGGLVAWNIVLIPPFALKYVSPVDCVTVGDMARAVGRVISGRPPPEVR